MKAGDLAEAVQQAARVAPSKGEAFDKAQGVVLRYRPDAPSTLEVVATDLETTYIRRVDISGHDGDAEVFWRLPSGIMAGFLAGLPGADDVVLSDQFVGKVLFTSGKSMIQLTCLATSYPTVEWQDPGNWSTVGGFATGIKRVTWAVADNGPPLTGVHITGQHLVACDRVSMAFTDLEVPVDDPITVPLGSIASVVKRDQEIQLAGTENRLLINADSGRTQMSTILFVDPYPATGRFLEIAESYTQGCKVNAAALRSAIQRMLVLCKGERYPVIRLEFRNDLLGGVHLTMEVDEIGWMQDSVDVSDLNCNGDNFVVFFTPDLLVKALDACGSNVAELRWDDPMRPVAISSADDDYICMVQPRGVPKGTP